MNIVQCIKVNIMAENADYTGVNESVLVSGGSLRVCIDILIHNDDIVEYNENFYVELSTADESLVLSVATAEIVIVDDDGKLGACFV